jgi:hydroxymethylpyrimidine kinase/phosphomethylpyrimidine kinase/thiamine-phosphate diphosphorylase
MNSSIIWTIAGSDCTGGAGIQADTKTAHNLGAEVCSVITAVTAQNSFGVKEINPVSDPVLLSQIHALEEDKQAKVIKIGLLANEQQVELVCGELVRIKSEWEQAPIIVYDPVAVASSGGNLTEDDILPVIKSKLLPLVDVLTPNNNELQKLSGVYVFSWTCIETAAQKILDLGVGSIIIKGGHIDITPNKCVDYCTDGSNHYWLASDNIDTEHSHGTGCSLASAVGALLAQGYLLRDAFTIAKAYINQGLKASVDYDGCYGPIWQGPWPHQISDYPEVLVAHSPVATELDWHDDSSENFASDFASVNTDKLGLYPVVNSVSWCKRLLETGVKTIQYREKNLKGEELEQAIQEAIKLGDAYNARLFINDYWQLAIKHNAYGVHLGQEDLADADLLQIKQAGLRLGVSTHGHYEMLKALQYKPSYLAVGAIFPTKTKDMTGQIQGIKTLQDLVNLNQNTPMVAIGGITLEKAPLVAQTGVGCIAVVTAITEAESPENAVIEFNKVLTDAAK